MLILITPELINDLVLAAHSKFSIMMFISAKVGDDVCDPGNNNLGCDYDGGDCCLPQAEARDCIDPCGVRLKFYGGQNSEIIWNSHVNNNSALFQENVENPPRLTAITVTITGMVLINVIKSTAGI